MRTSTPVNALLKQDDSGILQHLQLIIALFDTDTYGSILAAKSVLTLALGLMIAALEKLHHQPTPRDMNRPHESSTRCNDSPSS